MSLTLEELKWTTILALTEPPQRCKPGEPPGPEPPVVNPYLTFYSADGEFTLSFRNYYGRKTWNGTLEYSTDTNTWQELSPLQTIESSNKRLYLRGLQNGRICPASTNQYEISRFVFSGTNIECMGNIETLLDYDTVSRGEHPIMGSYAFAYLFSSSPLISMPYLPAQNLSTRCYNAMYWACRSLKISETSDSTFCYPYRIPTDGIGVDAFAATASMFQDTGGPFTGDPAINTTYYTDHKSV